MYHDKIFSGSVEGSKSSSSNSIAKSLSMLQDSCLEGGLKLGLLKGQELRSTFPMIKDIDGLIGLLQVRCGDGRRDETMGFVFHGEGRRAEPS